MWCGAYRRRPLACWTPLVGAPLVGARFVAEPLAGVGLVGVTFVGDPFLGGTLGATGFVGVASAGVEGAPLVAA